MDPDVLISEPVAISTRVAPSFIRVGQLELFSRRARKKEHPKAMEELEKIVLHLIDREYGDVIDQTLATVEKVVLLAREFLNQPMAAERNFGPLKKGFYTGSMYDANPEGMDTLWSEWLTKWKSLTEPLYREALSRQMKLVNPKYSLREWFVVPAYQQAAAGSYSLLRELQEVMTQPYAEQSKDVEEKYYRLKPPEFFDVGGSAHYSCSS